MDKALLNFLAIICFVGTIMYVLPMADIDLGASISHLTTRSLALLPSGWPPAEQVATPRPVPTIIEITPWPPSHATLKPTASPSPSPSPVPTALPSPTPAPCPTPSPPVTPSPSPAPTAAPGATATPPAVIPAPVVTIVPSPAVTAIITPGPANVTAGPVSGNATAAPPAGNATEQAVNPGSLFVTAIVILALLLVALIAWNRWREKK